MSNSIFNEHDIVLVYQGLSSDTSQIIRGFQEKHCRSVTLSTHVAYSDDPEMQERLEKRKELYQKTPEHENAYYHSAGMFGLSSDLSNAGTCLIFVDSFNLHVSNVWLGNNSLPPEHVEALLENQCDAICNSLELRHNLNLEATTVIFTNDISQEPEFKTPDALLYSRFIQFANTKLIQYLKEAKLKVTPVYLNGSVFRMGEA